MSETVYGRKQAMKRLMIALGLIILMMPSADAKRKTPKSGTIKDGVFTDAKFGYSISISDGWSAKRRKNKDSFRLVLVQKKYGVPTHFQTAEDYTKVPRIVLWSGETSLSARAFTDSLLSHKHKSDAKSDILKEFEFLAEQDIVPKGKRAFKFGDTKGYKWWGEAKYIEYVSRSASSAGGKRVESAFGGGILAVKKDDLILVFHIMAEKEFFLDVFAALEGMASTLVFAEAPDGE